jgi:hypothetical protein
VPFDGSTTYDDQYQEWQLEPSTSSKPKNELKIEPDTRNFTTTQHSYHDKKESIRIDPFRPNSRPMNNIPFNGSTTHDDEYREWDPARTQPIVRARNMVHEPDRRNFTTTQHTYHDKKESTRAAAFKPKTHGTRGVPFDGSTTYDSHYQEFDCIPAKSFSPERTTAETLEHRTFSTSQQAHNGRAVRPPKPIVPTAKPLQGAPFDGSTTYDENYQEWAPSRVQPIIPAQKVLHGPDGRNFTTTQQSYHDKKESIRTAPVKPASHRMSNVPFDGSTTHDDEYREWELPGTKSCKPELHARNNPDYRSFDTTQAQHTGLLGELMAPIAANCSWCTLCSRSIQRLACSGLL